MEAAEDNRKLISASTPLEIYAVLRGASARATSAPEDAASALSVLRLESARMVQQPLNPAVLEAARQLLDRTTLRWTDALQLGAAHRPRATCFRAPRSFLCRLRRRCLKPPQARDSRVLDPRKTPPCLGRKRNRRPGAHARPEA
jgi:hypothetical protein